MQLEVSVTEFKELFNQLQSPDGLFSLLRLDVREQIGGYLSELMKAELSDFLGREKYERQEGKKNYRNGFYDRKITLKGIGKVEAQVPRDRQGAYQTQLLPRSQRYEKALVEDLSLLFLTGISTRTLAMLSQRLIGRKISHSQVSRAHQELSEAVLTWRERDLSEEIYKYLYIDGVHFKMRIHGSIELVPVLVVKSSQKTEKADR